MGNPLAPGIGFAIPSNIVTGTTARTSAERSKVLAGFDPGQQIPVTVQRQGSSRDIQVTLGQLPGT